MARSQKAKAKQSSIRSRSARRAPSPAPASLTNIPRAASPTTEKAKLASTLSRPLDTSLPEPLTSHIPSLALTNTAGVHKKTRGKKLSAKQRKRKEEGILKAEAALEKFAKKVDGGVQRGRTVKI
ncbi:hypothetical protein BJ508DRAFT_37941 [Ascobolus immersus RN42]|uniref:Uncharacterized protein n=1 Tax=Ascobolus immersus RN42 TaxID=1160509 RepID=A0A3N4II63_ASCIM|nr:hypothetical protein BJ508DRAFT_37941 [Ascobolus immersus RN42]